MVHGALAIPGRTDGDEVVITKDEIAASGLDYLALGHWHSAQKGKAGGDDLRLLGRAGAGRRRPGRGRQRPARHARRGRRRADASTVEERAVGKTTFERRRGRRRRRSSRSRPSSTKLREGGDPDLVLDVRLIGVRPDELDLDIDEVEAALAAPFLQVRVRDRAMPALTEGAIPPPRHDRRRVHPRRRGAGSPSSRRRGDDRRPREAAELRDVLRLGRLLLAGHEVTL